MILGGETQAASSTFTLSLTPVIMAACQMANEYLKGPDDDDDDLQLELIYLRLHTQSNCLIGEILYI